MTTTGRVVSIPGPIPGPIPGIVPVPLVLIPNDRSAGTTYDRPGHRALTSIATQRPKRNPRHRTKSRPAEQPMPSIVTPTKPSDRNEPNPNDNNPTGSS